MANIIKLPQYLWYEPREVEFPLPDGWQVTVHNIRGYNRPAMKPSEIRDAIASPIGMPPLREFAKGKKEVVIIFDDLTRSTQTAKIVPHLLQELSAAGISDSNIRFIAAVANHQALDRISMEKKLGNDVLARFLVYNHCPFMNCTCLGTTSYGTEASINSEVINCDLKIGIGQVTPHPSYGFSGGAKIIMPGVASYDTITTHHRKMIPARTEEQAKPRKSWMGVVEGNQSNADAREMAKLAGLDMVVDCIVNMWAEPVAIFAGALEPTYQASVKEAQSHYIATNTCDNDIVIANAYHKSSEAGIALLTAQLAVSRDGGESVLIANSPSGRVVHYLFDSFGKTICGDMPHHDTFHPHIKRVIIYNEYPEASALDHFVDREKIMVTSDWSQVIKTLEKSHGAGTKVAVYPCADIQYFAD